VNLEPTLSFDSVDENSRDEPMFDRLVEMETARSRTFSLPQWTLWADEIRVICLNIDSTIVHQESFRGDPEKQDSFSRI